MGGETPRTPWRPLFPTIHPRRSGVPPPPLPPADLLPPPAKGETKVLSQNVAENLALEMDGEGLREMSTDPVAHVSFHCACLIFMKPMLSLSIDHVGFPANISPLNKPLRQHA